MPAKSSIPEQLAKVRLVVAYLGEAKQSGWWDCNFLDATGLRFMETTFPRTAPLAALRACTEAACLVHDKAMGRVGTFHLFRLPPALEDHLEHCLEQLDWQDAVQLISSPHRSLETLNTIADCSIKAPEGPIQVGVAKKIMTATSIKELAAHYASAFQDSIRCFPYFVAQ